MPSNSKKSSQPSGLPASEADPPPPSETPVLASGGSAPEQASPLASPAESVARGEGSRAPSSEAPPTRDSGSRPAGHSQVAPRGHVEHKEPEEE